MVFKAFSNLCFLAFAWKKTADAYLFNITELRIQLLNLKHLYSLTMLWWPFSLNSTRFTAVFIYLTENLMFPSWQKTLAFSVVILKILIFCVKHWLYTSVVKAMQTNGVYLGDLFFLLSLLVSLILSRKKFLPLT